MKIGGERAQGDRESAMCVDQNKVCYQKRIISLSEDQKKAEIARQQEDERGEKRKQTNNRKWKQEKAHTNLAL